MCDFLCSKKRFRSSNFFHFKTHVFNVCEFNLRSWVVCVFLSDDLFDGPFKDFCEQRNEEPTESLFDKWLAMYKQILIMRPGRLGEPQQEGQPPQPASSSSNRPRRRRQQQQQASSSSAAQSRPGPGAQQQQEASSSQNQQQQAQNDDDDGIENEDQPVWRPEGLPIRKGRQKIKVDKILSKHLQKLKKIDCPRVFFF